MTEKQKEKVDLVLARIQAIMKEVPAIAKDLKNEKQGYNYRGIDVVCNKIQPLLAKHGVFYTPSVVSLQRDILDRYDRQKGHVIGKSVLVSTQVEYTLYCPDDGSTLKVGPILGEGMDVGDKASAKAMTGAMKTMLLEVFCIPVQSSLDPDNDKSPEPEAAEDISETTVDIPEPTEKEAKVLAEITKRLHSAVKEGFIFDGVLAVRTFCYGVKGRYPGKVDQIGPMVAYLEPMVREGQMCHKKPESAVA